MHGHGVCVFGSLNIDLTVRLARFHQPGETVYLGVNVNRVNLFDKEKETTLLEGVESHV